MRFLLVAAAFSLAVARVSWKNSELLDQFDLQGSNFIDLRVCSRGCFVFVSLPIERSGCEDNIVITQSDVVDEHTYSLSQVAALVNSTTGEKGYVEVELPAHHSAAIANPHGWSCPVAIFAVSKYIGNNEVPAPSLIDPSVKDRGEEWHHATFFSYEPYTINGLESNEDSVVSLYHTGYDSTNRYDHTNCNPIRFEHKSKRVLFPIRSPLLTIVMGSDKPFSYSTKMGIENDVTVSGDIDTIVASPGYIGCRKGSVFRYDIPQPPVDVHFTSEKYYMSSTVNANLLVAQDNSVLMSPLRHHDIPIYGDTRYRSPISAEYFFGEQLNITWTGTYEWTAFAIWMKISASLVEPPYSSAVAKDPLSSEMTMNLLSSAIAKELLSSTVAKDLISSAISKGLLTSEIAKAPFASGIAKDPLSSAIAHPTTKGE